MGAYWRISGNWNRSYDGVITRGRSYDMTKHDIETSLACMQSLKSVQVVFHRRIEYCIYWNLLAASFVFCWLPFQS